MTYKWEWVTSEWDTLPETLTRLETNGHQIFSIVPVGSMDKFLKVIYRKNVSPE